MVRNNSFIFHVLLGINEALPIPSVKAVASSNHEIKPTADSSAGFVKHSAILRGHYAAAYQHVME